MPNIGPVELIIILVIALIVIGPGRLPDVGAALGKSIREFRKASTDITDAAPGGPPPPPAPPRRSRRPRPRPRRPRPGGPRRRPPPPPLLPPPRRRRPRATGRPDRPPD